MNNPHLIAALAVVAVAVAVVGAPLWRWLLRRLITGAYNWQSARDWRRESEEFERGAARIAPRVSSDARARLLALSGHMNQQSEKWTREANAILDEEARRLGLNDQERQYLTGAIYRGTAAE